MRLGIDDDGVGFDLKTAHSARHGHFGLLDMHERTEKMGGAFLLNSEPGSGTSLVITVMTDLHTSAESNHLTNGAASAAFNGKHDARI